MHIIRCLLALLVAGLISACARTPLTNIEQSLRPAQPQQLQDDLSTESLQQAISVQLARAKPSGKLQFGPYSIEAQKYRESLQQLADFLGRGPTQAALQEYLEQHFVWLEVYGRDDWGEIFITSYYEPLLGGSAQATERYSQPLYRRPQDLLVIDPRQFDSSYEPQRAWRGRVQGSKLVPYYARAEIDGQAVLAGRNLELCWVDPVDAFFLQIQGSGSVQFEDGSELVLRYAEKNGHPYKAVGALLREQYAPRKVSMALIRQHLAALGPKERQEFLNNNPSYVFFEKSQDRALTALGVPANAGRTIASDRRWFPKGALAMLEFKRPIFEDPQSEEPATWQEQRRLVLDQDVGGAITGPGRVDLFWGRGPDAGRHAGVLQGQGRLWYLFPKSAL
jgi:membrane-bound lytic murein transglycosylase A